MNDDKKKAILLLKTARGQIDGIIKMIEDERYCVDVSNQITAVQSLVKKANKHILTQHLFSCVDTAFDNPDEKVEKIKELNDVFTKLLDK